MKRCVAKALRSASMDSERKGVVAIVRVVATRVCSWCSCIRWRGAFMPSVVAWIVMEMYRRAPPFHSPFTIHHSPMRVCHQEEAERYLHAEKMQEWVPRCGIRRTDCLIVSFPRDVLVSTLSSLSVLPPVFASDLFTPARCACSCVYKRALRKEPCAAAPPVWPPPSPFV